MTFIIIVGVLLGVGGLSASQLLTVFTFGPAAYFIIVIVAFTLLFSIYWIKAESSKRSSRQVTISFVIAFLILYLQGKPQETWSTPALMGSYVSLAWMIVGPLILIRIGPKPGRLLNIEIKKEPKEESEKT